MKEFKSVIFEYQIADHYPTILHCFFRKSSEILSEKKFKMFIDKEKFNETFKRENWDDQFKLDNPDRMANCIVRKIDKNIRKCTTKISTKHKKGKSG